MTTDTIINVLSRGGSVRISAKGHEPETMKRLAAFAKRGGGHVTFVIGDTHVDPDTLNTVSGHGQGSVTFDFVSHA